MLRRGSTAASSQTVVPAKLKQTDNLKRKKTKRGKNRAKKDSSLLLKMTLCIRSERRESGDPAAVFILFQDATKGNLMVR